VVRRRRLLPMQGQVLVEEGQPVTADAVVARAELPGDVHPVNVAARLGIAAGEIGGHMLKSEGEAVAADESIAETRPWLKFLKVSCSSPVGGTIESISSVTGQVMVREPARPVELTAYVDGRVAEVMPREGVVVEARAALVQGIFGIGGECVGGLKVVADNPSQRVTPRALGTDCRGCVVVLGALADLALVQEAREAGVKALISGSMSAQDLKRVLGYELGVAITGSEDVGLTVVLTEGFGRMAMAAGTFDLLKKMEGRRASVNGATQIRAGVLRPEVLIPLEGASGAVPSSPAPAAEQSGLRGGSAVRVIREPFFGRIGRVLELTPELAEIETEASVRVVKVELEGGAAVTVPRANVELIEL